jgi:hypothetical protein
LQFENSGFAANADTMVQITKTMLPKHEETLVSPISIITTCLKRHMLIPYIVPVRSRLCPGCFDSRSASPSAGACEVPLTMAIHKRGSIPLDPPVEQIRHSSRKLLQNIRPSRRSSNSRFHLPAPRKLRTVRGICIPELPRRWRSSSDRVNIGILKNAIRELRQPQHLC